MDHPHKAGDDDEEDRRILIWNNYIWSFKIRI